MKKAIFVFVSFLPLWANALTVEEIKQAQKRYGVQWDAGETQVSALGNVERQKFLGAILPENFGEPFISKEKTWAALPSSLDWRNVQGVNFASPTLNQGSCGSCVAFAAVTTLETQTNITRNTPYSPWAYSPQHLFACGGGLCERGWQPTSAAQFLKAYGVPDEACFPYQSGATGVDLACSESCSDSSTRSEKITSYTQPTYFFVDQTALKKALEKGPLMTIMYVYEDFLFYKSGVYKHVTGKMAGGHAITMVGWNDSDQAWIVKNSWGDSWGENGGYFRIAYSDTSMLGSQSWKLEVPQANGYVNLGALRDYAALNGVVQLNIQSTFTGTESLEWTLTKNDRLLERRSADALGFTDLDTTKYADGAYTLQAIARHKNGTSYSEPRIVYLLNGAFTGTVAIKNIQNGQTITGQTELDLETSAAPVPFTKMTFRAVNVATQEQTVRTTTNPTSKMTMLWRAQLLANGQYDLSLEGEVGALAKTITGPIRVTVAHP